MTHCILRHFTAQLFDAQDLCRRAYVYVRATGSKIRKLREKQADLAEDEPEDAGEDFFEDQLVQNRQERSKDTKQN